MSLPRGLVFFTALMLACPVWAVVADLSTTVQQPPAESQARWHFGAESVFAFGAGKADILPGAGLQIGKTPADSGFLFDAGVYVLAHGFVPPVYFHGGHQFSPNWRLWGYIGASILLGGSDISEDNFPIILSGVEGEWLPLAGNTFDVSLIAGMSFAYVVYPLAPYAGSRLLLRLSDSWALQALVRVFPTADMGVLGSAGLQVAL